MRSGLAAITAVFVASCGGSSGVADAGHDAMPSCTSDRDCDDGVYCNGPAACVPGVGCVAGAAPCATGQLCSESARTCTTDCGAVPDADSDGHRAILCGGDDCDDADPNAYPGNTEVCDTAGHDEDCDVATFGFRDADGDGYGDASCCDGPGHCGTDCDDGVATVHPTQAEVCNGVDDDCNGLVDDHITITWTVDVDHDGHGDAAPGAATMVACMMPDGYAQVADDCDDHDAGRHPGLAEICDGIDNDCSLTVDDVPGLTCDCTVGMIRDCGLMGRCMGATQSCIAGTWGPCSIAPIAETCNDVDDDCNGVVDDGLRTTCYPDVDGDGFAPVGASSQQCIDSARMASPYLGCPTGYTGRAATSAGTIDCCDAESRAYPGQTMAFVTASACTAGGGFDFNCDGASTSDAIFNQVASCPGLNMTNCFTSGSPMYAASGYRTSVPACGVGMDFFGNCYWNGSACQNSGLSPGTARPCR